VDDAVSATIVAVGKKVLMLLLGDEKGRKFLLYVVGIALFVVCIPLITLLGLFGWMAGIAPAWDGNSVLTNIPTEQVVQLQTMEQVCNTIATTFEAAGLEEADCQKATAIYLGHLVGMENRTGFYDDLVDCFLGTTEKTDVYFLISQTFLVGISEDDKTKYDGLYGITPIRATKQTEG
jgi:hypothetical protein